MSPIADTPNPMPLAARLKRFFSEWNALKDRQTVAPALADRLQSFFSDWRMLSDIQGALARDTHPQPCIRDLRALTTFFAALPLALRLRHATGRYANPWRIAGLAQDERRHLAVLAWWLNPRETHGQADFLLQGLLQRLLPARMPTQLLRPSHFGADYTVRSEVLLGTAGTERVDIEICGPEGVLFIEGKIQAPEGLAQLERYCAAAPARAGNRPWALLYLTPTARIEAGRRERLPHVIECTWRDIAAVLREQANTLPRDHYVRTLLSHYADHIGAF